MALPGDAAASPTNGSYGIQSADTATVGPFEIGWLYGGAQVFLFILAIGGFGNNQILVDQVRAAC
ncbi:hypothetical protein AB0L64_40070 [Kribbella sp. NPDC051936]|uniref:hypothetical protein n=1 Tax=Kribbella sp. NPDC051936 TaxID=3154946 RepID=UPI003439B9EC